MYYDCHVHSVFSPDAVSGVGEYCDCIDLGNIKAVGFAEHLDFLPECGAYGFLNYSEYRREIELYKNKEYELYAGAEVDYVESVEKDIIERLKEEKYDFTIGSIHMVDGLSVSDREISPFYDRNTFISLVEGYYREVKAALAFEPFDAIGHIGVYRRYLEKSFFDAGLKGFIDEFEQELARLCALSGKIVEVNSSGLFCAMASTVPDALFLKRYYEFGGRMVCMSSDAHNARHAGRGFETIQALMKNIGFEYIHLPWKKVVKLE